MVRSVSTKHKLTNNKIEGFAQDCSRFAEEIEIIKFVIAKDKK